MIKFTFVGKIIVGKTTSINEVLSNYTFNNPLSGIDKDGGFLYGDKKRENKLLARPDTE